MNKHDLSWIRRRTNVEDLLDDGIENNSVAIPLAVSEEDVPVHDPRALAIQEATLRRVRAEQAQAARKRRKPGPSIFGVFLGVLLVLPATALLLFPVDMRVYHQRIRGRPDFIEHVTPPRSRLYAGAALLLGMGVLAWALARPREPESTDRIR